MNDLMGYGSRVLVVDSDEFARQLVTDRLDQAGFTVVQARDGFIALQELHRRHFDVVLTDCTMPRLSGLDLLRQCRLAWPRTPVIVMSEATDRMGELAAARGAFACLRKPLDADRLIALVCLAVRRSETFDPALPGSVLHAKP